MNKIIKIQQTQDTIATLIIQGAATAIAQLDLEADANMVEKLDDLLKGKGIEQKDIDYIFESSDCISSLKTENRDTIKT